MTSPLLILLVLVSLSVTYGGHVNEYDKPFDFNCDTGSIISYISSTNDNYYEDRLWEIDCRITEFTDNCVKSDYVNDFDKPINFTCPGNTVLVGIESYHDNYYEDRRFKFNCCEATVCQLSDLSNTGLLNDWDAKVTLLVPEGSAIKSVYSFHDDYYEDRRWSFQLGKL
ncbi:hypothetical protein Btru_060909 [Bulinus truncatus]|nr:hypothetical protein Btru_060909 [Bulinus truncatus]